MDCRLDLSQIDRLANLDLKPLADLGEAQSLHDLERLTSPFVDSMWPSSKNESTTKSDELWYLFTLLRGGFDKARPIPDESEIFSRDELGDVPSARIARLTEGDGPTEGSLERWRKYFRPQMLRYLEDKGFPLEVEPVFVYGDTHGGGWGELPLDDDRHIRIYNCGGWTMAPIKDHHPACHLFAVDEAGEEYMFDVSFKDAKVGDDSLLELAARDSEHRRNQVSAGVRGLGGLLGGFLHA